MTRLKIHAVTTSYWTPGQDYLKEIVEAIKKKIVDDDLIVVSEKAVSTALNNIVDENKIRPGVAAELIATFWMKIAWGFFLGPLCRFHAKLLTQLRSYPSSAGSRHKQVVLQHAGLLQALMFGSEGGIDGSNLPYSYVSLPLPDPEDVADKIRLRVSVASGKKVSVMIVDTDKTYSYRTFHFTPRPTPFKGIHSFGGVATYAAGRFLGLKKRATPLAVSGVSLSAETALGIAETANRARGHGAGGTVWDMAETFKVPLTEVTWKMLETVKHKPIVLVRKKR